jgi:hypothetical protein
VPYLTNLISIVEIVKHDCVRCVFTDEVDGFHRIAMPVFRTAISLRVSFGIVIDYSAKAPCLSEQCRQRSAVR